MRIKLLLFGAAGAALGAVHEGFALPDGAAAAEVASALVAARPEAAAVLGSVAVAVNRKYVRPDHLLREGDEVALIPPVSGG
jgi:MoaE-MoaD fusion protein